MESPTDPEKACTEKEDRAKAKEDKPKDDALRIPHGKKQITLAKGGIHAIREL